MKKNREQVLAEIEKLEALLPKLPKKNYFGEDVHEQVEAQIQVLCEDLDDDDIYAEWEDEDDYDYNRSKIDSAIAAREWATGSTDISPSDDWAPVAKER
jgi:hypothetical protein